MKKGFFRGTLFFRYEGEVVRFFSIHIIIPGVHPDGMPGFMPDSVRIRKPHADVAFDCGYAIFAVCELFNIPDQTNMVKGRGSAKLFISVPEYGDKTFLRNHGGAVHTHIPGDKLSDTGFFDMDDSFCFFFGRFVPDLLGYVQLQHTPGNKSATPSIGIIIPLATR